MAVVVAGTGMLLGRPAAALATTGALCVSILDQPLPVADKARLFALAVAASSSVTFLATLCGGSPWALAPLIAATSALTALVSIYGRRALGIGVSAVLALLFGMAAPVPSHTLFFAAGGIAYAAVALVLTWAGDERTRKLLLGEAMLAFARYVEVKARLLDTKAEPRAAWQSLIEAHADLVEKLQAARDLIFTGGRTRWVGGLIALLDTFDTILSSDADIETLRATEHRHLMNRFHALLEAIAAETYDLARGFMTPRGTAYIRDRKGTLAAINDEITRVARTGGADITAFRATAHKLAETVSQLQRLSEVVDPYLAMPELPPAIDLQPFVQASRTGLKVLRAQMTLASPIGRYAVRLTLAMLAGFALTLIFPAYIHGGWVMLTTALIMRASYSMTLARRNDRVLGNLAGCLATIVLVRLLPTDALAATVVIAIAAAHAFAAVDYKVTAFAACVSALLQLHFVAPVAQPVLFERMLDTLIGAGLAWGFSYVLPSWERRNIPKLVKALGTADRDYAARALARLANEQELRLARKRAHDAAANLSTTVRRLAAEPDLDPPRLAALQELLAANYLLVSDLASMRILFQRRASELDQVASDALLSETLQRAIANIEKPRELLPLSRHDGTSAAMALKRRLVHIEHSASRLGNALAYFS